MAHWGYPTFASIFGKDFAKFLEVISGTIAFIDFAVLLIRYVMNAADRFDLIQSNEKNYLSNVSRFLEDKNIEDAIFLCEKYLQKYPEDKNILKLLIRCYIEKENEAMAAEYFNQYVAQDNTDTEILKEYEEFTEKRKLFHEHIKVCRLLTRLDSFNPVYYFKLIKIFIAQNNVTEAVSVYTTLITNIDRNNPEIAKAIKEISEIPLPDCRFAISLCVFFRQLGLYKSSVSAAERGLKEFPDCNDLHQCAAHALLKSENKEEATRKYTDYLKSLKIYSKNSDEIISGLLSNTFPDFESLSFSDVLEWISAAESLDMHDALLHILTGAQKRHTANTYLVTRHIETLINCGKYLDAFERLEYLHQIAPHMLNYVISKLKVIKEKEFSQKVSIFLASLLSRKSEIAEQINTCKSMLEENSMDTGTLVSLSRLYYNENMLSEAKKLCEKALGNSRDLNAAILFARVCATQDNHNDIVAQVKDFIQKSGISVERFLEELENESPLNESPVALKRAVAKLSEEFGLYGKSEHIYARLAEQMGNDPEILYEMALLNFKMDRFSETISLLQKIPNEYKKNIEERKFLNGVAFLKAGYENAGRELLEKIDFDKIQSESRRLDIIYHTANILNEKGSYDKAMNLFKSILLTNINYKDVKQKVNKIELLQSELKSENNAARDLPPEILSRFSGIKLLGEGGMGKVYRAFDSKLSQQVAVKILADKYKKDAKAVRRFILRDGKSAEGLDHPNIIKIFDVVSAEAPFIVMELIEGKSLRDILNQDKPLSQKLIRHIITQSCRGFAHAHENNVVHRDIKPDNIMLTKDAQIKIMDFGLAKKLDVTTMTETGETFGTILYMPPEQVKGQQIDNRADIYSFGVLTYELLTKQPPFNGDNAEEVIYKIFREDPIPPSVINPDIPKDVDAVILKAMEKEKEQRYQNILEFMNDFLEKF